MSASSKKKLRNELNAAKMTERQLAEQAEAKKLKLMTVSFTAVLALILVVAVAIIKQLSYRHTVLHSKDSEFADWQAAMLSPDWEENVKDMVQRAMNDTEADLYMEEDGKDTEDGEDTENPSDTPSQNEENDS